MDSLSSNIFLRTIPQIAAWQINAKSPAEIKVAMPAMQRGYVWSASQVEGLWDSLVRHLPIGSFLVTRYQKQSGTPGKAGGLKECEPLKAVEYVSHLKVAVTPVVVGLFVGLPSPGF